MKKLLFLIVIIGLSSFAGCDKNCEDGHYKPYDCNENEPVQGDITVKVTINEMNPAVLLEFFFGDVEENIFYFSDTLDCEEVHYNLNNNDYSVRAKYKAIVNGKLATVYSIDGGKLSPSKSDYCDGTCYEKGTLSLNARLELK